MTTPPPQSHFDLKPELFDALLGTELFKKKKTKGKFIFKLRVSAKPFGREEQTSDAGGTRRLVVYSPWLFCPAPAMGFQFPSSSMCSLCLPLHFFEIHFL